MHAHLRNWQNSQEIDPEIQLEIASSNGPGIRHKLAAAKETSRRLDERRPKTEKHVNDIEKICQSSKHRYCYFQVAGDFYTTSVEIHLGEIEEERVDEDGHQAGSQKERIPSVQRFTRWV